MGIFQIIGVVVATVSGFIFFKMFHTIARANMRLQSMGIEEPLPWTNGMRLVVGGWFLAFLVGLALIFFAH
jgi:hypothetical protein